MIKHKFKCKICGQKNLELNNINLHNMPGSAQLFTKNKSKKNKTISIKLFKCIKCNTLQIKNDPVSYYKNVIRTSAISKRLVRIRVKQFNKLKEKFNDKSKFVEIGCGRGENIEIFSKFTKNIYGIENSKKNYKVCIEKNLKVFNLFLNRNNYKTINKKFDFFFIFNYFEHIPNIKNFIKNLKKIIKENAIGIIEVPNFDMIKKKRLYTEIILDHLAYFEKKTLVNALELNGLKVLKIETLFDDYILSATVMNKNKHELKKIHKSNFDIKLINRFLEKYKINILNFFKKFENKSFIIWGAGHQSLTFISYFKVRKYIKYIVDSAKFKQNKYAPGSNLIIKSPAILKNDLKIKNILVLAGGYTKEISNYLKKNYKNVNIYLNENNKVINL